jgi:hypothetical protein
VALRQHRKDIRGCRRSPFEGAACQPYGGRRHSVTELTPALPHSATQRWGWPPPRSWWNSVGMRFPGVSKSWRLAVSRHLMPVHGGRSAGNVRADAPERGRPCPRGCLALERGGPHSRVRVEPSSETDPARGGVKASSKADLTRGSVYPSSEAGLTRGASRCAALAGCGGHQGRGRVFVCVLGA